MHEGAQSDEDRTARRRSRRSRCTNARRRYIRPVFLYCTLAPAHLRPIHHISPLKHLLERSSRIDRAEATPARFSLPYHYLGLINHRQPLRSPLGLASTYRLAQPHRRVSTTVYSWFKRYKTFTEAAEGKGRHGGFVFPQSCTRTPQAMLSTCLSSR
jgi:hypothetical protein